MSKIIDTFIAPPCYEQIEILSQDEDLVLINKPAGLLSLSGKNPRNLDSVHHRLVEQETDICHVRHVAVSTGRFYGNTGAVALRY